MNGIRPKEILEILRALEDQSAAGTEEGMVLATVVSLDGSVYSRAGAMALFVSGTSAEGTIPVKSMERRLHLEIDATADDGRARLITLDIGEDDPLLGYGFCAAGKVEILLEPVEAKLRAHMSKVREALLEGEGVVCAVEIEGPDAGRRTLYSSDHPEARECYRETSPELVESSVDGRPRRLFFCPIHPMGKVVLFGSGPDAAYLAYQLCDLGFSVYVADPRPERLGNSNWDRNRAVLIEGGWERARTVAKVDENTAVVVMNHSISEDLETLKPALQSAAFYVGYAGSPKNAQQLLLELEKDGVRPRGAFFAPAGLDIGAETPEETALSLAAELLAARSGRKGGKLSARPGRLTDAGPGGKWKIPGLILAAGMGRRFTSGHKLSALYNGRPVLRHVVENALASRLDPVVVVLGCEAEAGLKVLSGIQDPKLRVVFNPLWATGKASSIEVGLRETLPSVPGVVSLMGDMPMVKPWLIDRIISEFELSGKLTFPVFPGPEGAQKGCPTAFPRSLFAEVKALTGDDTSMSAVREHWSEAVKVPLEDAATQLDVDTAEDIELIASPAQSLGDHP